MANVKLSDAINRIAVKSKNLFTSINTKLTNLKTQQDANTQAIALKESTTSVDAKLALKEDKTSVDAKLALKEDKTSVDAKLALKEDKTSVNTKLDAKQNKTDATLTTSNKDIAPAINEVNAKANNALTKSLANVQLATPLDPTKKYLTSFTTNADGTQTMSFKEYVPSSGGGGPTRKDITATYATRKWNANDAGKKVWITVSGGVGIKVGFISEGLDTKFSDGGAVVDLGINYTDDKNQARLFWSTERVTLVGYIDLNIKPTIEIKETALSITKFEIEE